MKNDMYRAGRLVLKTTFLDGLKKESPKPQKSKF